MIERMYYPALDYWAAQPIAERQKMLEALKADTALANHDFAGLPPQVWSGIAAGLAPAGPPPETMAEEPHARKKRGE